ncbi:MAG: manganese efflux pump [Candidatus Glassbacteria bacterium]|nr:manganese efflux pump [Candidatus Glassbacteria bacterium]
MDLATILLVAVGLAMDAFAVAVAVSLKLQRLSFRQIFRLSFHFGLFQFLMPVLGWSAGAWIERWVSSFDHWIAFGLLAFIGGRMIFESGQGNQHLERSDPTRGWQLVALSVATSIDALAVGLGLGLLEVSIWAACIVIGIVATAFTIIGMQFGRLVKPGTAARLEILGGLVLIGIGVKILLSHTLAVG